MPRRTMADVDWDLATLEERKRTLLEQLRLRFKSLSPEIEQVIKATQDADRLAEWLRGVITARDLAAVGILPRPEMFPASVTRRAAPIQPGLPPRKRHARRPEPAAAPERGGITSFHGSPARRQQPML